MGALIHARSAIASESKNDAISNVELEARHSQSSEALGFARPLRLYIRRAYVVLYDVVCVIRLSRSGERINKVP